MAEIQLLLVSENKVGSQNSKVGHVTLPLHPFDLICMFSVRPPSPQCVHKMASWSALIPLRYGDF